MILFKCGSMNIFEGFVQTYINGLADSWYTIWGSQVSKEKWIYIVDQLQQRWCDAWILQLQNKWR